MADDNQEHERRLAVYGTLGPGGPNHHVLVDLGGRWFTGTVRGHLQEAGWGAELGYPGIRPDPSGPEVPVHVLESDLLPAHWARLDEFEGPGYRRAAIEVETPDGPVAASIYRLA
ncbi:MAG: gamma-glutamylcyclotransferase [Actinomycetota bacterium]